MATIAFLRTDLGFDVTIPGSPTLAVAMSDMPKMFATLGFDEDGEAQTRILQLAVGEQGSLNMADGD